MNWIETGLSLARAPSLSGASNVLSTMDGGNLTRQMEALISIATDGDNLRLISPVIDDHEMVTLICKARKRGVIVRVMTTLADRHGIRTKGWDASHDITMHDECVRRLAKSGVLLRSPITTPHAKLIYLSDNQAIFGSANLAKGSLRSSSVVEVAIPILDPPLLGMLADAFDALWNRCSYSMRSRGGTITLDEMTFGLGNKSPLPTNHMDGLELLFSAPGCFSAGERLAELVNGAQDEILLIAMSLYETDQIPGFGQALHAALNRGVHIQVVVRPEHFKPSDYPDKSTIELIRNGMVLTGITGLHAKGFLIDGTWCGIHSANFNPYSLDAGRNESNVEMMVVGHPTASQFMAYASLLKRLTACATHTFLLD